MPSPPLSPSSRTRVRRKPSRASYERSTIDAILDEGMVAHMGFAVDGQPYVIPTLHARVGDTVYFHGSAASRTVRALASGTAACLTVTLLDGLVLARSVAHHSVNYRSVVVFGTATSVQTVEEREVAMRAFTERLLPGRWAEVRAPTEKELRSIGVLSLPLNDASAKLRTGPPLDDEPDYALETWAGVIPLRTLPGAPVPDPRLPAGTPISPAANAWCATRDAIR
jgi:uncharacterized protein